MITCSTKCSGQFQIAEVDPNDETKSDDDRDIVDGDNCDEARGEDVDKKKTPALYVISLFVKLLVTLYNLVKREMQEIH
jgi:hypothetical protein